MWMRFLNATAAVAIVGCVQQPTDTSTSLSPRSIDGLVRASVEISADRKTAVVQARVEGAASDSLFWAFRASPDTAFMVSLSRLERVSDGQVITEGTEPGRFFINFSPTASQFTPLRRGATGSTAVSLASADGTPLKAGEYRVRIRVVIYGVTDTRRGISSELGAVTEAESTFALP